MIIVDTHAWVWWVHGDPQLSAAQLAAIGAQETDMIGVSAISCWEIAKLVQYGRLELPCSLPEWFEQAFKYPGVRLIELTPQIAVESTQLPGTFHRDPADQIIGATARHYGCALVTSDAKLLSYLHVTAIA